MAKTLRYYVTQTRVFLETSIDVPEGATPQQIRDAIRADFDDVESDLSETQHEYRVEIEGAEVAFSDSDF